jgi:hypothetical protein
MNCDFNKIVSEINAQNCILFLGPEIQKIDGKDIQEAFFDGLDDAKKADAIYYPDEKLWSFRNIQARRKIIIELGDYYNAHLNEANELYKKIAALPFHLIISLIPDDSISKTFNFFNVTHTFDFFTREQKDCIKPGKEHPLIYNLFGNIEKRDYVLSHQDFHSFTEAVVRTGFPTNLKDALFNANHLIFLGIGFDKWYHVLLLYILNSIKSEAEKIIIEEHDIQKLIGKLMDVNLNIEYIENDYEIFLNNLFNEGGKVNNFLRKLYTENEVWELELASNRRLLNDIEKSLHAEPDPVGRKKLEREKEEVQAKINDLLNSGKP